MRTFPLLILELADQKKFHELILSITLLIIADNEKATALRHWVENRPPVVTAIRSQIVPPPMPMRPMPMQAETWTQIHEG